MAQQTIIIGAAPNDNTGDTIRDGGDKINDNFTELYAADAALDTRVDALEAAGGAAIEVLDEGVSETATLVSLDFVGAGVAAVDDGSGNVTVTIGGGGSAIEVLDEGVSETSTLVSLDFVGAGVSATDDGSGNVTVTVSGGGGGGAWQLQWTALQATFPTSNFATLDSRNNHAVLDFDTTTQEAAYFSGVMPVDYAGGGITVSVFCLATSATSGTIGWDVAIERMDASTLDIDADSFATAQTVTATTVPGTSGQILKLSVNIANGADMDSLAAGEAFRLRVRRDVANDTATGDAELLRVMMVEQ